MNEAQVEQMQLGDATQREVVLSTIAALEAKVEAQNIELAGLRSARTQGALEGPYQVMIDELMRSLRMCVRAVDEAQNGKIDASGKIAFEVAKLILRRAGK